MTDNSLAAALIRTSAFLDQKPLTQSIAELEHELHGADARTALLAITAVGVDEALLRAVLLVRRDLGRINDVIHAAAIARALPHLLEPDERIERPPSLAAGNDPSRPFDLMTNRRLAEFKVSVWKGADPARKRGLFADLAHLALHDSADDRRRQLFVIGPRPIAFLATSNSPISWALDRGSQKTLAEVAKAVGLETSVRDFTAGFASRVELIDLCQTVPEVGSAIEALGGVPYAD